MPRSCSTAPHLPTRDIDTFETDTSLLARAAAAASAQLGFAVPIGSADVGDLPLHYEDREEYPLPLLRRLRIAVPERHDLVLSKLLRASEADLQVCKEIHEHERLDIDTLVDRYLHEMNHAIGAELDRDMKLVAGIEYIWDAHTADRAEQTVKEQRHRKGP